MRPALVLIALLALAASPRAQQRPDAVPPTGAAPPDGGLRSVAEQREGPFASLDEARAAILRVYHEQAEARRQALARRSPGVRARYARLPRVERGRAAPRQPRVTAQGLTFIVDSAYDERDVNPGDGVCANTFNECTLRAAIEEANRVSGSTAVEIRFAITSGPIPVSAADAWTVPINFDDGFGTFGPLPAITRARVLIDGLTQTGSSCGSLTAGTPHSLKVVLDGALLGAGARGVTLSAPDVRVRGLVIGNVPGAGVHLEPGARAAVECSYVGTDASGLAAAPNGAGVTASGVLTVTNSLVSGNAGEGIGLLEDASSAVVERSLIGTDRLGAAALGNGGDGVVVVSSTGHRIGGQGDAANVISGNAGHGVALECDGCRVEGNLIGTDRLGGTALGNVGSGVDDASLSGGNLIRDNTVSGNGGVGVRFDGFNGFEAVSIVIEGNRVGTDAAGTAPLGNGQSGIALLRVNDARVRGNVVGANGATGLYLEDGSGHDPPTVVRVEGNAIGTDATGAVDLGNALSGIRLVDVGDVVVGGEGPGTGNRIAFNGRDGVFIEAEASDIALLGNAVYDNAELGIDLAPDGVTPNDPLDADGGANALTNYPVLSSAERVGETVTIRYSLDALPNRLYRVEFFGSPTADPSGYGEAEAFGGSDTVVTDPAGSATATATLPVGPFSFGSWVVATATPVGGGSATGYAGTSEYSQAVQVVGTSTVLVTLEPIDPPPPVVVAHGDRIRFRVTITLGTGAPTGLDYWADAVFPNGNEGGPYLGPEALPLPPGATGSLVLSQRVGSTAPPGVYTYVMKVGRHPDEVNAQDSFEVTIVGSGRLGAGERVFEAIVAEGEAEALEAAEGSGPLVLHAAVPNPTTGRATLRYDVPVAGPVRLAVYDVLGRAVAVLADGAVEAGPHAAVLDAALPAGAYLVRLTAGGETATQRITVAR